MRQIEDRRIAAKVVAEERRRFREVIRSWSVPDLRGSIFICALKIADEPRYEKFYTVRARAIGHELRSRMKAIPG